MNKNLKIKLISTILIFSFFLVSCSNSSKTDSMQKAPIKENINFRITWPGYSGRGVAIQKIIDLYNTQNSKTYEIALQSGDENLDTISGILSQGSSVPILVLPYRFVKYLGSQGSLSDLTLPFDKIKDQFYPELWKLGVVDNYVYGIPWLGHSICLIYNKNLLNNARIDPASIKSLESLVKAIEAIEAATTAKGIGLVGANHNDISWMVNQFIYGFGSGLVDESGKKVIINNGKSKAAIDFYKNTLGPHAQPSWKTDTGVEVMDHFRKQEIAFEFQSIWGVTDIEKNGNPFETGVINLETIGLYAEVGPMMLSIPANMPSEKQKEALNFINFMISPKAQEEIMAGEYSPEHDAYYPFRVPARMDMAEKLIVKTNPQYIPFIKGFKNPCIDVPIPKWQKIKDTYYAPGLHKVMNSEMTTDEFLKTIEIKGNEILYEN